MLILCLLFSVLLGCSLAQAPEVCVAEFEVLQGCLSSAQQGSDCPIGWTYFPKTHACYFMLPDGFYSFLDAEYRCRAYGGHLASIHSHMENNFAAMLMEVPFLKSWQDLAWIGLKMENQTVQWTDGSPFNFNHWLEGEPNPGPGVYGVLLYANKPHPQADDLLHRWDDIKGNSELRSGLCKKAVGARRRLIRQPHILNRH